MRRSLLALAVLPLALAACNGTANQAAHLLTPTASVKQAAAKTSAVTSAHIALNATGAGALTGSVTGSGDFDNATHRGSFHLDISGYGSIDAVVDGTSAYVKAPLLARFLPAGKSWLKLNARRSEFKFIPQSPKQALARVKKLANVHVVGDETIDGVDTTHYQGTGRTGSGTVDVWIGKDDGYVRRIQAAAGGAANGNAVVDFSNFGEPVTVTVPPASDTADATNLIPFLRHG